MELLSPDSRKSFQDDQREIAKIMVEGSHEHVYKSVLVSIGDLSLLAEGFVPKRHDLLSINPLTQPRDCIKIYLHCLNVKKFFHPANVR